MKKPDEEVLKAIIALKASTGGKTFANFLGWFRDSLKEQRETNDDLRGEALLEGAVRAQQLKQILKTVDAAPESLAKLIGGRQQRAPSA